MKQCSFDELNEYFRTGTPPSLAALVGDTDGEFLAWRPGASRVVRFLLGVFFRQWLGKRFYPVEAGQQAGHGINFFERGATRYAFRTEPGPAIVDGRPCLKLDYSIDGLMRGVLDDVRQIGEGLVLGRIHYRFFWQKQPRFYLYFALAKR